MKDLFNDPKEKFKLKRTSIARKPKRKNRKQNKDEKSKTSSNVDNQGYDTRIPKSRKGRSAYARSTTRGWQSELEQLRKTIVSNTQAVYCSRGVWRRTFNTTGRKRSVYFYHRMPYPRLELLNSYNSYGMLFIM